MQAFNYDELPLNEEGQKPTPMFNYLEIDEYPDPKPTTVIHPTPLQYKWYLWKVSEAPALTVEERAKMSWDITHYDGKSMHWNTIRDLACKVFWNLYPNEWTSYVRNLPPPTIITFIAPPHEEVDKTTYQTPTTETSTSKKLVDVTEIFH